MSMNVYEWHFVPSARDVLVFTNLCHKTFVACSDFYIISVNLTPDETNRFKSNVFTLK